MLSRVDKFEKIFEKIDAVGLDPNKRYILKIHFKNYADVELSHDYCKMLLDIIRKTLNIDCVAVPLLGPIEDVECVEAKEDDK